MSIKNEDRNGSHAIVGHFFVGDVGERKGHQGRVIAYVVNGFYLVQFFGWVTGDSTCEAVVALADLVTADFYSDQEDWVAAGERLSERNAARLRMEASR
jgi:hypothetical protein